MISNVCLSPFCAHYTDDIDHCLDLNSLLWYVGRTLDETWLTVGEVAAKLRVKPKTVRKWIKNGTIRRATMITRRAGYLIPAAEVERLLH